jgi:uncharacterized iron-regulated protein
MPGPARPFWIPLLILLAGCAAPQTRLDRASPYRDPATLQKGEILHLATGRLVSEGQLLESLSRYPIVYVGETHDSLDDHAVELFILSGLHRRSPGSVSLGIEMLPRTAQADLDAYLLGDLEASEFEPVWTRYWGHSFAYYEQILRFARDNRIHVLALNVEEDLRKAVRRKPPAEIESDLAGRLPEMDLEDPYHRSVTQAIFASHPMGPQDAEAFYRVQVLWDETMADTAARYLRSPEGRGKQLVVLAGAHHVRHGCGIPRRLFRRVPLPFAVVLPLVVEIPQNKKDRMMNLEPPPLPMPPADFLWAVGYTSMDDLE